MTLPLADHGDIADGYPGRPHRAVATVTVRTINVGPFLD